MEEGSFTGIKLTDYINGSKTDYLNARRIINGTDRASDIRDYAVKIEKCLKIQCNCGGKDNSENDVNIHFVGQSANEDAVSQNSIRILKEVGKISKNNDIYITSTARSPYDQARIMFDNCERDIQEQRNTYLEPGQKVIDVYASNVNKTRNQVITLMEAKINELGPSTVSKHCANPNIINVFDISVSRLSNPNDFLTEIRKRREVDQVLIENAVYHVEITQ